MAQHKSAEKRNRQNQQRRERNAALKARMRTAVKAARAAITDKAPNKAEAVKTAVAEIYGMASKKVLTKATASRYVARLMKAAQ